MHIEVADTTSAADIDRITRSLQARVYQETGIVLTGVGVYSYNTGDDEAAHIRDAVQEIALHTDGVLQFHGFYLNPETKDMRFDVVLAFGVDPAGILAHIRGEVQKAYPDYHVLIAPDLDLTD